MIPKIENSKEQKPNVASDTVEDNSSHIKITSIEHSQPERTAPNIPDSLTENRAYYSRNFKVSRGKQTSSANQGDK